MIFLSQPHLIMVDGWRKISFFLDGEYRHIPTDRMINDLCIPPTPSNGWNTLSPDAFDDIPEDDLVCVTSLKQEVNEIFNHPDATWELVRKCMFQKKYRTLTTGVLLPLYREVALRSYREPQSDDADSMQILQDFSNIVVLNLTRVVAENQYQERSLFANHFTNEHYKYYLYLTLVECYCMRLLPCPLNKALNRQRDYKLYYAIQDLGFISQADSNGFARNVLKTKDACYARFTDWRWTRRTIVPMLNSEITSNPTFIKSFKEYQNEKLYKSIRENRNAQTGVRSGEYAKLLHQCLFCYRFRLVERSGNGLRDLCCGRDECKKNLNAFQSHLKAL